MGKKRVFAALLALAVTVGSLVLPARAAFTDTTGHWAETAITKWSEEYSIINGYEDGTFRPDNSITRGAFAGILDRFLKFQSTSPAGTFSDLSGNYWEDAILKLHFISKHVSPSSHWTWYSTPRPPNGNSLMTGETKNRLHYR